MSPTHRAGPLPPDERRAALVAATLPLVRAHGSAVTTRQLAEASGVAEGTIFRVFPDKDALIQAAIATVCDPAVVIERLGQVDPALPLRARLIEIVAIVQDWMSGIITLMTAVRTGPPTDEQTRRANDDRIAAVLMPLIRIDRAAFRCRPEEVARMLKMLVTAGSHPRLTDGDPLTAREIVDLLLDGVLARPGDRHDEPDDRC